MSGECDFCGEHCLECRCQSSDNAGIAIPGWKPQGHESKSIVYKCGVCGHEMSAVATNFTFSKYSHPDAESTHPQWISVKDRLPEKSDAYLTHVMDNGCSCSIIIQRFFKDAKILTGMYGDCKTHWEKTTWDDWVTTHWMPLPEPPKD